MDRSGKSQFLQKKQCKYARQSRSLIIDDKTIIIVKALFLRLIVLLFVVMFSSSLGTEFDQNGINPDDRRYEAAAKIYADSAHHLIDLNAFVNACLSVKDVTGVNYVDWFYSTPLWYWIVFCIVYVFRTIWAVRIINIIISCITINYLYKYCELVGGKKYAQKAAELMTWLPSPLFFCCFAYKDQLVMLCIVYLMYCSSWIRRKKSDYHRYSLVWKVISGIAVSLMLLSLRSGIGTVLIVVFILNAFKVDGLVKKNSIRISAVIPVFVVTIVAIYILIRGYSDIVYKINYYFDRHSIDLGNSPIRILAITSFKDIYKLPCTLIFSLVMPINLFARIDSWYNLVASINIVTVPIAVGLLLDIFQKKIDNFLFLGLLFVYLMSIVASVTNFRHYYSLLPVIIVGYVDFKMHSRLFSQQLWKAGSSVFIILLVWYYLVF